MLAVVEPPQRGRRADQVVVGTGTTISPPLALTFSRFLLAAAVTLALGVLPQPLIDLSNKRRPIPTLTPAIAD